MQAVLLGANTVFVLVFSQEHQKMEGRVRRVRKRKGGQSGTKDRGWNIFDQSMKYLN